MTWRAIDQRSTTYTVGSQIGMVTESMPWVREGDSVRCKRHDVLFDPSLGSCAACDRDPGPEPADDIEAELPTPPDKCFSSEAIERWFTTLAVAARESARRVAKREKRDFHDESAIAKHRETAIKAMRAAGELALRREDEALVRARERRIRDRARGASH
jgi:hypothetical protein